MSVTGLNLSFSSSLWSFDIPWRRGILYCSIFSALAMKVILFLGRLYPPSYLNRSWRSDLAMWRSLYAYYLVISLYKFLSDSIFKIAFFVCGSRHDYWAEAFVGLQEYDVFAFSVLFECGQFKAIEI